MVSVVIVVGIWQVTRWIFTLVDAIEAPPKRKAPPTLADARRERDPRK